jgi:hypothetical protein
MAQHDNGGHRWENGIFILVIINIKVTLMTQLQYSSPLLIDIDRLVGGQRMYGLKLVIKNYMKLGRYVTGGSVQDQRNLRQV